MSHRAVLGVRLAVFVLLLPQALRAQVLEVRPAWEGRFSLGQPTEIAVTLVSPIGGEVRILASGGDTSTWYSAPLEAQRPLSATLPIALGPDGRLKVAATLPDGTALSEEIHLQPRRGRFVVEIRDLGPSPAPTVLPEAGATGYGPDDLPRSPAGYRPVAGVRLEARLLAYLEADQTQALAAYLAACGRLEVRGASDEVLKRVRAAAGCAARQVTASTLAADEVQQGGHGPDPLPGTPWLEQLQVDPWRESPLGQAAFLLLPYPILLLGLAGSRRLGAWLLLVPAGAALAYAWLLPRVITCAYAVTWAEMEAGDPGYRLVSLLRLAGNGQAQAPLHLVADAGILSAADMGPLEQHIQGPSGAMGLPFPRAMLQERRYLLVGTATAPLRVRLEPSASTVRVVSQGETATPPGWLAWHGVTWPVPSLAPGASHTLGAGDAPAEAPVAGLPTSVSTADPVLLLPLPARPGRDERLRESGWLLIRSRQSDP